MVESKRWVGVREVIVHAVLDAGLAPRIVPAWFSFLVPCYTMALTFVSGLSQHRKISSLEVLVYVRTQRVQHGTCGAGV